MNRDKNISPRTPDLRRVLAGGVAAALALTAAGCSQVRKFNVPSTPSSTTTTHETLSPYEQVQANFAATSASQASGLIEKARQGGYKEQVKQLSPTSTEIDLVSPSQDSTKITLFVNGNQQRLEFNAAYENGGTQSSVNFVWHGTEPWGKAVQSNSPGMTLKSDVLPIISPVIGTPALEVVGADYESHTSTGSNSTSVSYPIQTGTAPQPYVEQTLNGQSQPEIKISEGTDAQNPGNLNLLIDRTNAAFQAAGPILASHIN